MIKPLSITLAIAAAFPQVAVAQEELTRVVVTGSNIRTTQKEGASAVQVLTAKELAATGKVTISDILRTISANSGNSYNEQYTGSFSAGTSGLSLRGLAQRNTLILVNGKRVSSYATAQNLQEVFVDLNSLPMAAVQRIEVLKDGASSVYGSDAVAGVVNIILYKEFTGTEVSAQVGSSTEGTGQLERSFALQTGFGSLDDKGWSVVFSLDGQKRDKLQQSDVSWLRSSDFRGNPNGTLGWVPTNYYGTSDPTKLLGGVQGPLQIQNYGDITPGKSGSVLAYNAADYRTLIPGVERAHASLRGTLKLNENTEAYAEGLYGYSWAEQTFGAPLTVGSGLRAWNNSKQALDNINVLLPVGHPNNSTNAPQAFTATLFDLGARMKQDKVDFYRVLTGIKGSWNGWDYDASVARSGSKLKETVQNFVNRYEFEKVLAEGSYNFADQSKNSEAVRNRLRLSTLRPAEASLSVVDFNASKELLQLPAGALGFAFGGQWRQEEMDSNTSTAVLSGTELRPAINIIKGKRDVSAAFAEFNVPVLKDLTVNLAGRADHYNDFGSAFSPKASVRYQAAPWLLVRGTVSRGFRAPSLPEITNSTSVSYGSVIDKLDPITPTQPRGITNLTVANTELSPERSNNFNFGVVLAPSSNTSVGVDFYRIRTKGVIGTESADTILANEKNQPEKVVRDAQGRILTLYRQYANQGERLTTGIDLDLRHKLPKTSYGNVTLNAQLSRVFKFSQPLSTGAALTNGAGTNYFGSIPKWRGTTSATWELGQWTSNAAWNFVDGYDQTTRAGEHVKPVATVDLNVGYKISAATSVNLIVTNLFDRKPSWDSSFAFFDYTQADPRGRFASIKLNHKF
ncbi:TonB-dependent receptor [Pseudoduganella sp. DS3]|uniref:TonB-dependent receptor n=1 Tax=Pseudoduganella guangdongensis TaxID=2692179 RepID=A0A6N9HGP8_9BURK|nr:TonB-dependent receptor [Pseudoduganella guangdongensis]MYN02724.1 TonB-dependent receptor [Pseudoduganella guangdongensis]